MHRGGIPQWERAQRSRLAQWVGWQPMVRGTLNERQIVCGRPTCGCARGEKHDALYLVRSRNGQDLD